MSKGQQTKIESMYFQQLHDAFDLVCVAEKEKKQDLCELSVHYIFDLIDWGRRNMEIKDTNNFSLQSSSDKKEISPKNIIELEKIVEDKLINSGQIKNPS